MTDLFSPKQVARALGVSESSLKRWCDRGLLETVRTAGGHRKLPICDVLRFVRENDHPIVCREVLGLPTRTEGCERGLELGGKLLADALLSGNEALARQVVFDLYLARHSVAAICDRVLCKAFREIGDRWQCNSAHVYQERRGCEFSQRILYELRRMQVQPDPEWTATGGTLEGDTYVLPTTIVELVLRDAGWNASSLGTSIPAESMAQAILDTRPKLFWVSASCIPDTQKFVEDFSLLTKAAQSLGTALVIGGRAFTEEIRQKITFCCYCDTMQQLEAFATSVRRMGQQHTP